MCACVCVCVFVCVGAGVCVFVGGRCMCVNACTPVHVHSISGGIMCVVLFCMHQTAVTSYCP